MMRKFLIKSFVFLSLILGAFVLLLSRADERTDEFYARFISPNQSSLIIGTSRAAQAINPKVLNDELNRSDIFNYAFTNEHSPYGPVYLKSILAKMDDGSRNGIFILSVDPWSLSADKENPEDLSSFRENGLMLDGMIDVSSNPNFFYLMKYYDGPFKRLLLKENDPSLILHKNGWLEVDVPMDSSSISKRTIKRISSYRDDVMKRSTISNARLAFLEKTINTLSAKGKIFLIRLPVCSEMSELENDFCPEFDSLMMAISIRNKAPFYAMMEDSVEYIFTDGNHLARESSSVVSSKIAEFIKVHAK